MESALFPFKQLPIEVRLLIYVQHHLLAIQHDNSVPNLLLALAPDRQLFEEAQSVYKRQNFSLSAPTANTPKELSFKAKPMSELLRIRHLKLVCQATSDREIERKGSFHLRAHKILLMNDLESLTFVMEKGCDAACMTIAPQHLMNASRVGVTRVVLKIEDPSNGTRDKRYLDWVCQKEGVLVKATDWRARYEDDRWREEIWVWEADEGKRFKRTGRWNGRRSISSLRDQQAVAL